jgi:hypothetical protein
MTDEVLIESAADEATQKQAEQDGWIPPSRYKGAAEDFVDAEEFIKRGETVLPIVKKKLESTRAELAAVNARATATEQALAKATAAIAEINERHTVATQRAVEAAKREVKAQLEQASAAGDHAAVAELTQQMVDLKDAVGEAKVETKEVKKEPPAFVPTPDMIAWNAENPWFGTDRRKTAFMLGIAEDMRVAGDKRIGREFFDAALEEMNTALGVTKRQTVDKTESGGRGGSANEVRTGGGKKGFASLPAEAKAACVADERQFVGPDKKYKTAAEWHSKYADLYFSME